MRMDRLWSWLPTALSSADSAIAIITGLVVFIGIVIRFGVRGWRRTKIHRRRAQSKIIDQLAPGRPLEAVESLLGMPAYITLHHTPNGGSVEERYYRMEGAWVTVQATSGSVQVFSVTITDENMYYDTGLLTFGIIPVRLGRDTFTDAPPSDHESIQIGARHATFVRYYDYGCTAAGGQYCWLAHNGVGAGLFTAGEPYGKGTYSSYGGQYGTPPDVSAITVNTITIMSPVSNPNDMRERWVHGPHHDQIRRG
jgi:hypothetical protein